MSLITKICAVTLLFSITTAQAETSIQPFSASKAIDLTHAMHDDMPFWPGGVPFAKEALVTYESGGYLLHKFVMGENTGTHVDAPSHFIEGNLGIDSLPIDQLILPMIVIDVKSKVEANPDYELSTQDVRDWESKYGSIPKDSLVVMNSGWHSKFNDSEKYINMDSDNVMHFPGYSVKAGEYLVKRGVAGIGIDTLSLDHGPSKTFGTHVVMLKANKYQVENMANLDAVPAIGATAVIGVLPIKGGSQAQARIFALIP
ncbi:MAG: cyclase family protein [Gammaproteobacteria bacterium]|nr:cyclase family protein [Gammaproteobacteria bacterium]